MPDTVAATRLPPWLLPTMPARVRDKLCSDILIIEDLPLHAGIALTTASPSLSHMQSSCRIHIILVGYCSDSSSRWLQARPAKELQHVRLCSALRDAGWMLAQPPCPLLAGTLSSCSSTLGPSLSRSQDTSSHFGCPRKMFAHSRMMDIINDLFSQMVIGVCYSCLGRREGAYNPCPKWARIYRLMTESGSKAFPASRAPEV